MSRKSDWISDKIRKLRREGYAAAQAAAIAYDMEQRRGRKQKS